MEDITKKYKKYKLKPSNESMKELCQPSKFKLQPQQTFLPEYLYDNKKKVNGLLIYHRIGSGKTCTAINIAEKFKKEYNIMVVLPAALIGNFKDELMSNCPGEDIYMKDSEKQKLKDIEIDSTEYKEIMEKVNDRIDKYYKIYSYHKFVDLVQENKIKLKDTILIIDEIQNMISMTGTFYRTLKSIIDKTDSTLKVFLLSATPMFDRPVEIALTLNLLRPQKTLPIGIDFNNEFLSLVKTDQGMFYKPINLKLFKDLTNNMISYYRGAPPTAFPSYDFKIVKCNMSEFQYKSYLTSLSKLDNNIKGSFKDVDILKLPGDFFLGPRMLSNIAFPNKSIGDIGYSSLKNDVLQLQNIDKYSIKFFKIFKKIKKSEGPVFVYSNFKEVGGIKSFVKFIEYHGYQNYKVFGEGPKTYAIWSGDESHHTKEEIKHMFNQKENSDGSKIKIILGSPSIKEGVSLLRVEQIHILEPYWNFSRIQQIIGRGIRFCSHKDVSKVKQHVFVYLYLATHPKEDISIDEYIWSLAKKKNKLIEQFEHALKENAIDCQLFHSRNYYKTDDKEIICSKKL
uniref:Helicase ATP-binding domain-containing protein n=1 Tax=viral metagenome TaxID=1070528 RepID=A0A6C0DA31_9ZZZZ